MHDKLQRQVVNVSELNTQLNSKFSRHNFIHAILEFCQFNVTFVFATFMVY